MCIWKLKGRKSQAFRQAQDVGTCTCPTSALVPRWAQIRLLFSANIRVFRHLNIQHAEEEKAWQLPAIWEVLFYFSLYSSWTHSEGMAQRIQTSWLACREKKASLLWEPNFSTQVGSHRCNTSVGKRNARLAPTLAHQKWNLSQIFSCVAHSFFKIVFPLMHTNVMNIFSCIINAFLCTMFQKKKKSFDLFHTLNPKWQTSEMAAGCLFLSPRFENWT